MKDKELDDLLKGLDLPDDESAKREYRSARGGQVGGVRLKEQKKGLFKRTKEQISEDSRKAGLSTSKKYGAKFLKDWMEKNPEKVFEQNSKIGKKQGKINVESGHLDRLHEKYSKENSKYFDHSEKLCTKCNRMITGLGMYSRFHGDKCTYMDKLNEQKQILSTLPNEFNSNEYIKICKEIGYNRKSIKEFILKDDRYIEVLHEGTNQYNPSIFRKLYKD